MTEDVRQYKGVDVDSLTRQELVNALKHLIDLVCKERRLRSEIHEIEQTLRSVTVLSEPISTGRVPYYKARRADTLTRDELLEAYTAACNHMSLMGLG